LSGPHVNRITLVSHYVNSYVTFSINNKHSYIIVMNIALSGLTERS